MPWSSLLATLTFASLLTGFLPTLPAQPTPLFTLEAEAFRDAHDTTPGNIFSRNDHPRDQRATDVDLKRCSECSGGVKVGYTAAEEWLEYVLDLPDAGSYQLVLRSTTPMDGGLIGIMLDNQELPPVAVPNTGSWQNWRDLPTQPTPLVAGPHTLRVRFLSGNTDLDRISVLPAAPGEAPAATPTAAPPPPVANGATFYVSPRGSGGDGRAWASAWRDFDAIVWTQITPGATILVDGGEQSVTYHAPLIVAASGTAERPITIRRATEAGRNGQVILAGGRDKPQPTCGERDTATMKGVPANGVQIMGRAGVVLDGGSGRGLVISGWGKNGVLLRDTTHITLRHVELTNNGTPSGSQGMQLINARHVTVEHASIHDNGVDGIQGSYVEHLTVRRSWFGNRSPRPYDRCAHADGIQIFGDGQGRNGDVHHITIVESVFGPNLVQALLLGENNDPKVQDSWAVVRDVVIRDTLFYDFDNAAMHSHNHPTGPTPQRWLVERVTSYRDPQRPARGYHNLYIEGSGHTVRDSIMVGLRLTVRNGTTSHNCQWATEGQRLGETHDPLFANAAQGDFALRPDSPCAGMGSRITSLRQFLAEEGL